MQKLFTTFILAASLMMGGLNVIASSATVTIPTCSTVNMAAQRVGFMCQANTQVFRKVAADTWETATQIWQANLIEELDQPEASRYCNSRGMKLPSVEDFKALNAELMSAGSRKLPTFFPAPERARFEPNYWTSDSSAAFEGFYLWDSITGATHGWYEYYGDYRVMCLKQK